MELKERIIQETQKLMCHMGPSAMTMDSVAWSCGISKRTLYEQFSDKETLLRESVQARQRSYAEQNNLILQNSENCFEALFKVFNQIRQFLDSETMSFSEEMRRLYPEVYAESERERVAFVDKLSALLVVAQHQGLVEEKLDTKIIAYLFVASIDNLHRDDKIAEMQLDKGKVFESAFINFLRGIATIKGIGIIENFLNRNKN